MGICHAAVAASASQAGPVLGDRRAQFLVAGLGDADSLGMTGPQDEVLVQERTGDQSVHDASMSSGKGVGRVRAEVESGNSSDPPRSPATCPSVASR
ncbi:hypothetical protein ACR6C2_26935 [Streptomyces sp. INA 01156]